MFTAYIKQTWRSLSKNKVHSLLNLSGLCAGFTCFAFIFLWVTDEMGYDTFNQNYDRIVRVTATTKSETGLIESAETGVPVARALMSNFAEIENTVRLDMHEELVEHEGKQVLQPGILLTDPSFFNVFNYTLTRGNKQTALTEPYSIVLTVSTAKKYFGNTDAMGKSLVIYLKDSTGRGAAYKVTGITPDPPQNAHFTFNILASFTTVEAANPDALSVKGWRDSRCYTYLLLKKGIDPRPAKNMEEAFFFSFVRLRFFRSAN